MCAVAVNHARLSRYTAAIPSSAPASPQFLAAVVGWGEGGGDEALGAHAAAIRDLCRATFGAIGFLI